MRDNPSAGLSQARGSPSRDLGSPLRDPSDAAQPLCWLPAASTVGPHVCALPPLRGSPPRPPLWGCTFPPPPLWGWPHSRPPLRGPPQLSPHCGAVGTGTGGLRTVLAAGDGPLCGTRRRAPEAKFRRSFLYIRVFAAFCGPSPNLLRRFGTYATVRNFARRFGLNGFRPPRLPRRAPPATGRGGGTQPATLRAGAGGDVVAGVVST